MLSIKVGDRVIVTDGSSDGHTGIVIALKQKTCIRIKRDADGVEVDVWYYERLSDAVSVSNET